MIIHKEDIQCLAIRGVKHEIVNTLTITGFDPPAYPNKYGGVDVFPTEATPQTITGAIADVTIDSFDFDSPFHMAVCRNPTGSHPVFIKFEYCQWGSRMWTNGTLEFNIVCRDMEMVKL